jgi:holin-like protein
MKILYQIGIILGISFVGEFLNIIVPLPIPASIYGLAIMLLCLEIGIVKVEDVKEVVGFFLEIMPVVFIPAAVGIIVILGDVKEIMVPLMVISTITTFIVMIVTGRMAQFIIRHSRKEQSWKL